MPPLSLRVNSQAPTVVGGTLLAWASVPE